MSLRSGMILDATLIMQDGFCTMNGEGKFDETGSAKSWQDNLLLKVKASRVEADLSNKGRFELKEKSRAAHSSAALAVNALAYLFDATERLSIPGFRRAPL